MVASRSAAAIALALISVVAVASLYLITTSGNQGQGKSSTPSSTSNVSTITKTASTPTTPTQTITSGGAHQLIGNFLPHVPIISQYLLLNYTLYFSAIGTVPSLLTVTLSSPAAISMSVSPSQIIEPGLSPYVNTTVAMRPSPSLPSGTYPINVQASGGGVTYNETLQVQVVKYLIVTIDTSYEPTKYTIPVGSIVTWLRLNPGGNNGLVTPDVGIMDFHIPALNVTSRNLLQFDSASYTFTKPGVYPFNCDFHPSLMNGVITVAQ